MYHTVLVCKSIWIDSECVVLDKMYDNAQALGGHGDGWRDQTLLMEGLDNVFNLRGKVNTSLRHTQAQEIARRTFAAVLLIC